MNQTLCIAGSKYKMEVAGYSEYFSVSRKGILGIYTARSASEEQASLGKEDSGSWRIHHASRELRLGRGHSRDLRYISSEAFVSEQ